MKSIPVTAAGVRIAAAAFVLFFAVAGCSLPERPVTKDELYGTGVYSFYQIKESPESVLAALNREGEVILDARYRDRPVYIKILALSSGLQVHVIDR